MKGFLIILTLLIPTLIPSSALVEKTPAPNRKPDPILTGADQLDSYLPYLKGKRVAFTGLQEGFAKLG